MNSKQDELRKEYTRELIKSGSRGKYHKRYNAEANIVVIDADLCSQFPNAKAVNEALRSYLASRNQT
jgi:hypothetical protein